MNKNLTISDLYEMNLYNPVVVKRYELDVPCNNGAKYMDNNEDKCNDLVQLRDSLLNKVNELYDEIENAKKQSRLDTIKEFEYEFESCGITHSEPIIRLIIERMRNK